MKLGEGTEGCLAGLLFLLGDSGQTENGITILSLHFSFMVFNFFGTYGI